ncbi:LysM peptidoglycan-binding domain-containing protein [Ligilactobacillus pobuzihii]|uniref:Peptidoglycan binding protein n=1 Tax=Ligilactobacillus pobuzihii TaxID=449659 RepID=A0A0R2L2Z8_9LACO|nr:LysM peptidoglycan-binding domain-containing protein [Ligilactobacillus pobuzihii]KRK09061.1 peptidoglycan binding protein [Ligilactobacillus pobuzihii E100301 = KCTC 13174]KRN95808.1 peptidoglycan binding protein [Ligilactobacillus pobuzihii]GEN49156.1 peptidase M23 [Ligilactobacillus pobuzihii]
MKFKKTLLTITAAAGMMAAGSIAASADTVTVKSGDTISSIAKENNSSVSVIEKANDLSNINMIYVGQKLEVGENGQVAQAQPKQQVQQSQQQAQAPVQQVQPKQESAQVEKNDNEQVHVQPQVEQQQQAQPKQTVQAQPKQQAQPQQVSQKPAATSNNSGNSSSEDAAKAAIANRESGGSYSASNGQYYGKYQLGKSMLNGDLSEANQEKTADNYVNDRYGSWSNALDHSDQYGWY